MINLLEKFFIRLKIIFSSILEPYSNLYWSQEGEDILIKRIFANKKNGFYVDVGAHHSSRFSNTYKLYKENCWNGVNIDPSLSSYLDLKKKRKRDININVGISDKKEILKFYSFNEEALNTFSLKKKNQLKLNYKLKKTERIRCKTLSDVLDGCLKKKIKIDLLTIDAEGYDLKVLKSNNWNKYLPDYIIVEISSSTLDEIMKDSITKFLNKRRYRIYSKLHKSVIFKLIN
jgi:FkbM family methyltransferase